MTEAWLAQAADLAARFALLRPADAIHSAADGYVIQAAAEAIADGQWDHPSWSHLDAPAFLASLGGPEARAARAAAAEILASFYVWQVGEGALSVTAALPVLASLTRASSR